MLASLEEGASYRLNRRMGGGSHGEVWRGQRTSDGRSVPLILKRLRVERGAAWLLSGLRERHYGIALRGEKRIARFVDAFEHGDALWLVFRDEGISLHDLIYTTGSPQDNTEGGAVIVRPSLFWLRLRQEESGKTLRHLAFEAASAVASLHARNITHRDLKPSNIIVSLSPSAEDKAGWDSSPPTGEGENRGEGASEGESGRGGKDERENEDADADEGEERSDSEGGFNEDGLPGLKLADLGSAVDPQTVQPGLGLYAEEGPTVYEETKGYQPPEASIGEAPYDPVEPQTYDLWSLGIVLLELLLGTPTVLASSVRAQALLELKYASQPAHVLKRLRLVNALAEHCILPPESAVSGERRVGSHCSRDDFISAVSRVDPLRKLGTPLDPQLLDLAWELLRWQPSHRLSAQAVLLHPAFRHRRSAPWRQPAHSSTRHFLPPSARSPSGLGGDVALVGDAITVHHRRK